MICKECGCEVFKEESKGIHVGLYCCSCGKWIKWVKQDKNSNINKDDYIKENMSNEDATEKQIWFIRNIIKYKGIVGSKLHASNLISDYKNKK